MNQLQNAVFEPITVGTRRRQTEEGTDYRGGPEAADTLFTPYVGFSLRIDIGEEGKGEEKKKIFISERSLCQAIWARSEVTSLKLWAMRNKTKQN